MRDGGEVPARRDSVLVPRTEAVPLGTATTSADGARDVDTTSPTQRAPLRATMRDASGHVLGTLDVGESAQGVVLTGTLRGLAPGAHAIHVHAVGRCDAPTFESAGGHWNPTARAHGAANPRGQHLGDLPNLTVEADGAATVQATTQGGSLAGAQALRDHDGAAIVVHARADDYRTDPSGNAGERIACGVVEAR